MSSLALKIEEIMKSNKGKIYSINDFYELGTKNTVKSILYRMNEEKKITRLIDGLYVMPEYSEILQEASYPDITEIVDKIAEKFVWKISPTGDLALNYTGLSTQVPNEYIYISNGPYREYIIKGKKIIFKHTTNRNICIYSKQFSILIQAIKAIGEKKLTNNEISKLAKYSKNISDEIKKYSYNLPFWIKKVLDKIEELNCEEDIRNQWKRIEFDY